MDISHMDDWIALGVSSAALVAGFFSFFFAKKKKAGKKAEGIISPDIDFPDNFWGVHTKIQETLTELRVKIDSARSHLVQFHNGGTFVDGISMKRMSLTRISRKKCNRRNEKSSRSSHVNLHGISKLRKRKR